MLAVKETMRDADGRPRVFDMSESMEAFVGLGLMIAFFFATCGIGIAAAWVQRGDDKKR